MKKQMVIDGTKQDLGKELLLQSNETNAGDEQETEEQKQKKAAREYKKRRHYVRSGESMYAIAQKYGIRLKSLYKMNHLAPDYTLRVGDELKLR